MKSCVRNKKTGEILFSGWFDGEISCEKPELKIKFKGNNGWQVLTYHSLAELNEEWEDYEPKEPEPLINDERFRKAVRAWAEANSIKKAHYLEMPERILCILTDTDDRDYEIGFVGHIPTLEDGTDYSIEELCGEEEE